MDSNKTKQKISRSDDDFVISFFSGTGKGGQHRNRHQNSVRMTHIPTGITQTAVGRERRSNIETARSAIEKQLDDLEYNGSHHADNSLRKEQIGSGQRGDKIRTYRFQDDNVFDHQTNKKMRCKNFLKGNVEKLW